MTFHDGLVNSHLNFSLNLLWKAFSISKYHASSLTPGSQDFNNIAKRGRYYPQRPCFVFTNMLRNYYYVTYTKRTNISSRSVGERGMVSRSSRWQGEGQGHTYCRRYWHTGSCLVLATWRAHFATSHSIYFLLLPASGVARSEHSRQDQMRWSERNYWFRMLQDCCKIDAQFFQMGKFQKFNQPKHTLCTTYRNLRLESQLKIESFNQINFKKQIKTGIFLK